MRTYLIRDKSAKGKLLSKWREIEANSKLEAVEKDAERRYRTKPIIDIFHGLGRY